MHAIEGLRIVYKIFPPNREMSSTLKMVLPRHWARSLPNSVPLSPTYNKDMVADKINSVHQVYSK